MDRNYIYDQLRDLISDGINTMKDRTLSEPAYNIWLKYSEKILELTTKDYNPSILVNYLRLVSNMDSYMPPYQKIGICLDYLIRVMQML